MGRSVSIPSVAWCLQWTAIMAAVSSSATTQRPRGADSSACKLSASADVYLSSGFGFDAGCAPSTGTLSAFMFFVDFPDQGATDVPADLYDFFVPQAAQWYADSSYGRLQLNVTADTSGFYRMPAATGSYGWERGLTYESHEVYIQDALEAYYAGSGDRGIPPVDVLYVVPTANATGISFSPTFMGEVVTRGDGTHVADKAVTFGLDAYETWLYKVLNHESGHTMCLPDLYPLDGRPTGFFVGGWDAMGYINGPAPDYFAWNKWRLGWLDDGQVECVVDAGSTVHTITPLEVGGGDDVKAVVVRRNDTAVLVAEVRAPSGVDAEICAPGVLLYTVLTDVATGEGPVQVLDVNPASSGCADEELNDATLSLGGTTVYSVPGWDVTVTFTAQSGDDYDIQIDVA